MKKQPHFTLMKQLNSIKTKPVPVIKQEADNEYFFGKNLLSNGVLYLNGEIDEESTMPLVASILEYNLMPENTQPDHITLFINSPGGYLYSAYQLIDTIKQSIIPVVTIGQGYVASAALMILMSGVKKHRMVSETCSIMSHQYSQGLGGKEHELVSSMKDIGIESDKMINHYKKCTGKSEKYIRKHLLQQSDCYLTPQEAISHGLIDSVLETY